MKFQLEDFHRHVPDDELLADLRAAFEITKTHNKPLTFRSYGDIGKYSPSTIAARFGSWNAALVLAGLGLSGEKNVSRELLFDNLRAVWVEKGKQPVFRDMAAPPSKFHASLYASRFGSWRKALVEFVSYVHSADWIAAEDVVIETVGTNPPLRHSPQKRTSRSISIRLRFRILLRDGFTCQACGASPIKDRGIDLDVDHVIPWSQGGETEDSNLQTKCKRCNLGKSDAFIG